MNTDDLISKVILGAIRHFLTTAGGGLIAHGVVTGDQWNDVVGAIMVVVPIAFSAYDKIQAEQSKAKAMLVAADVGKQAAQQAATFQGR